LVAPIAHAPPSSGGGVTVPAVLVLAVFDPVPPPDVALPEPPPDDVASEEPGLVLEPPGPRVPASPEGCVADVPHASAHTTDSEIARMRG
jgi:hypothetical protein